MRLAALVMLLVLSAAVHAQPGGGESLVLRDVRLTPEPLYPGESFNLSFRVVNAWGGDRYIGDAYVYLRGGYPFLNISPAQPLRLGTLTLEGTEVSYSLSVDPKATEGVYTLEVVLSYTRYSDLVGTRGGRERFTEVHPVSIKVSGVPELRVFLSGSEPERPAPGDTVNLELRVANTGNGAAENVMIYADDGDGVSPEWSSRAVYVGDIEPGSARRVRISAKLSDGMAPEVRVMPVQVVYRKDGRWVKSSAEVRVKVSESYGAEIYVVSSEPEKPAPGDTINLELRVVNRGDLQVSDLVLELGSDGGVKPLWSSRVVHVGDIPAGGTALVKAVLEAKESAASGEHVLPVRLMWRGGDANTSLVVTLYRQADFEVEQAGDGLRAGGKEQEVRFLIRNTGTAEAEHLRLTLRASYPFTPVGGEYYIRRLSPGETSTAVFHVDVDGDAAEQRYPVEIVVKWREDHEEHSEVEYSYIQVLGQRKRNYALAALALGAAALLLLLMKRRQLTLQAGKGL